MKPKSFTHREIYFTFFLALFVSAANLYSQVVQTFTYTGATQTFVVPSCVSTITLDVRGSKGSDAIYLQPTTRPDDPGGLGGRVVAVYTVTAGQVFNIFVGGMPYNGGGTGGGTFGTPAAQAGGGGASDIRVGGVALANRIIVAGGGGGGGNNCSQTIEPGGDGGGLTGGTGWECGNQSAQYVGTGGTQSAGGVCLGLSPGTPGVLGIGGNAGGSGSASGGGGGGYYGGSGSGFGGAGGGSSYTDPSMTSVVHTQGFQNGVGQITLTYNFNGAGVTATATPSVFCTGGASTLQASGVLSYTWSPVASNATSLSVAPTANTSYTVRGTNSLGCISTAVLNLSVNVSPTITIASNTTNVCQGQTVALTASGANTYAWNNSVVNSASFAPSATALYTVTGTNACGTATAGITVTVSALPVVAAASSTLICSASPATLTASGAATYSWNPGASTLTNYIVSPAASTIYTLTGVTGPCTSTATIAITTKTLPVISIVTQTTSICNGNTINLNATGDATTYSWSVGQTGTSISVTPTNTAAYSVTGTNVVNCSKTVSQIIIVNPNPVVNISSSNPFVCAGGGSTITASGAPTYSWSTGASTSTTVVNPTTTSTVIVSGINPTTTCHTETMVVVTVFLPVLGVTGNTSVCTGSNVVIGASGAVSYTWANDGSTSQSLNAHPATNTTYTVSGDVVDLISGITCPAVNTIDVNVYTPPVITAVSNHTAICRGMTASLTADGAGAAGTYTWASGLGTIATITVSPILNQTYVVAGTDANGCKGTATTQVVVDPCTGIKTVAGNSANLTIYPNPGTGDFTVTSDQVIDLHIVNELGQQVRVLSITTDIKKATVTNLANGVYFITGKNENGSVKQKIVVAK